MSTPGRMGRDAVASLLEARYEIPPLSACCIGCGRAPRINRGPVNDVTCVRLTPDCTCNRGFHFWQAPEARAALATQPPPAPAGVFTQRDCDGLRQLAIAKRQYASHFPDCKHTETADWLDGLADRIARACNGYNSAGVADTMRGPDE